MNYDSPRRRRDLVAVGSDARVGHRVVDVTRPTTVAAATRRLETFRPVDASSCRARRSCSPRIAPRGRQWGRRRGDAFALAARRGRAAATTGDPRRPPIDAKIATPSRTPRARDAPTPSSAKTFAKRRSRASWRRPPRRETSPRTTAGSTPPHEREAARRGPSAMAMWFGGNEARRERRSGVAFGVANRGVGEVIDAFVDDDLRAMRRVDLRAERNLADVDGREAIAAPFVFGSRAPGEDDGGPCDARRASATTTRTRTRR